MKKVIFKRAYLIVAVLFIISVYAISGVFARYSTTVESNQSFASPEEFYFECDFAHGGLYLFPTEKDFTLTVQNHDAFDRICASSITYTVTLDSETIVSDATLAGGSKSSATVTLPKEKLRVGTVHEVVITTKEPFIKTISFDISVVENTVGNFYTLEDKGNWVQLDLYLGTTLPDSLTIRYGSNFSPDNTHPLMSSWTTAAGEVTLTDADLQYYTHYTLIFFGTQNVTDVTDKTALPDTIILE